jgi:hypothetical protein
MLTLFLCCYGLNRLYGELNLSPYYGTTILLDHMILEL